MSRNQISEADGHKITLWNFWCLMYPMLQKRRFGHHWRKKHLPPKWLRLNWLSKIQSFWVKTSHVSIQIYNFNGISLIYIWIPCFSPFSRRWKGVKTKTNGTTNPSLKGYKAHRSCRILQALQEHLVFAEAAGPRDDPGRTTSTTR